MTDLPALFAHCCAIECAAHSLAHAGLALSSIAGTPSLWLHCFTTSSGCCVVSEGGREGDGRIVKTSKRQGQGQGQGQGEAEAEAEENA